MLYGLILVVHVFVCFVLIAVILLQAGRGGGLTDSFGGSAQSLFGTRGTVYLTRATSVCAGLFMITSLSLATLSAQRGRSLMAGSSAIKTPVSQPAAETSVESPDQATPADSAETPAAPTTPSS